MLSPHIRKINLLHSTVICEGAASCLGSPQTLQGQDSTLTGVLALTGLWLQGLQEVLGRRGGGLCLTIIYRRAGKPATKTRTLGFPEARTSSVGCTLSKPAHRSSPWVASERRLWWASSVVASVGPPGAGTLSSGSSRPSSLPARATGHQERLGQRWVGTSSRPEGEGYGRELHPHWTEA